MKRLSNFLFTVAVFVAIFVVVALMFCVSASLAYTKYFPEPTEPTEPTEPFSWSVVEEVGRDGDEVHYRIHLSNGMTVDRYTREGE